MLQRQVCVKCYSVVTLNGDGRTTVRPYISLLVTAPLHIVTRLLTILVLEGVSYRKVVSEGIGKLRQVVVALA